MLSSHKAIRSGSLQRHAIRIWSKHTLASLNGLGSMHVAQRFTPVQAKLSFCSLPWSRNRKRYPFRSIASSLSKSRDQTKDSIYNTSCSSSIGNRNYSGYWCFPHHGSRRWTSWGRYGIGSGCSDHRSGTGRRREEDDPLDWEAMSRKKQGAIAKRLEDLKRMIDADPYAVLFGRWQQWPKPPKDAPFGGFNDPGAVTSRVTPSVENARGFNTSFLRFNRSHQEAAFKSKSEPSSQDSENRPFTDREIQNEDLKFDPITMRMVRKEPYNVAETPDYLGANGSSSIPVKPFKSSIFNHVKMSGTSPDTSMNTKSDSLPTKTKYPTLQPNPSEPERSWLAREGFNSGGNEAGKPNPSLSTSGSSKNGDGDISRIESALSRHAKAKEMPSDQKKADPSPLNCPIKESTEEDVDLLFSSGVRASAGLSKRGSKPSAKEKQERRSVLSDDYEKRNRYLDRQLEEELASQKAASTKTSIEADNAKIPFDLSKDIIALGEIRSSSPNVATDNISIPPSDSEKLEISFSSQIEARKRSKAQHAHEAEVCAQKAAMEAIETGDRIASSHHKNHSQETGQDIATSNIMSTDRDASQKPEAIHAKEQLERKNQQLAKDKALVGEIRSIYEDKYGIIDTNHRHPSVKAADLSAPKSKPDKVASLNTDINGIPEQAPKLAETERHAGGRHKEPSGEAIPTTLVRRMYSSDPAYSPEQEHKVGGQFDAHQELLSEVYKTQNLLQDLSKRLSESHLAKSVTIESLDRPKAPDRSSLQPQNCSPAPLKIQTGPSSAEKTINDKKAMIDASAELPWNHSNPKSRSNIKSDDAETVSRPALYRILAYDPSTQRVMTAKNTFFTSPANERRPTVAEALSGLANPAKFLPHFSSLQNAGYEIVSGNSNILVFRKVGSPKSSTTSADEVAPRFKGRYSMHTNPIDGTTPQTGNFASPTGFVNYDSVLPSPDSKERTPWQRYPGAPKPGHKVRREEPVFSGSFAGWRNFHDDDSGKWSKFRRLQRRKRRRRTLKRMFWVGIWVAGCCYVVGVASEALRGSDSRKRSDPTKQDLRTFGS